MSQAQGAVIVVACDVTVACWVVMVVEVCWHGIACLCLSCSSLYQGLQQCCQLPLLLLLLVSAKTTRHASIHIHAATRAAQGSGCQKLSKHVLVVAEFCCSWADTGPLWSEGLLWSATAAVACCCALEGPSCGV